MVEAAEVELEPLVELGVQGDHLALELKQHKNCNFKWVKTTNTKVFTSRVRFYVFCNFCKNANTLQANVLYMPNINITVAYFWGIKYN